MTFSFSFPGTGPHFFQDHHIRTRSIGNLPPPRIEAGTARQYEHLCVRTFFIGLARNTGRVVASSRLAFEFERCAVLYDDQAQQSARIRTSVLRTT
jgi:hypothetical protein